MGVPNVSSNQPQQEWFIYNVEVLFLTPYIAPSLSPNKFLRKQQVQDIMKCYPDDAKEIIEHLDRAFIRDYQCNVIVPGHVFSAALRETENKPNIIVKGAIIIPKDIIRVGTSRAGNSLLNYEYIPPGTTATALFEINAKMPEQTIVFIGARKNKGFGKVQIKFEQRKIEKPETKEEKNGSKPEKKK